MSHPIPNTFTTYALSADELKAGQTLSSLNVSVLQNQRAAIAEEKLALKFTPNDIQSFLQQEAYLTGQLDLNNYILAAHEESSQFHHIKSKE